MVASARRPVRLRQGTPGVWQALIDRAEAPRGNIAPAPLGVHPHRTVFQAAGLEVLSAPIRGFLGVFADLPGYPTADKAALGVSGRSETEATSRLTGGTGVSASPRVGAGTPS